MRKISLAAILAVTVAGFSNVGAISAYAASPAAGASTTTTTTTTTIPNTPPPLSNPPSFPRPRSLPRPPVKAPLPPDTPGCYRYLPGAAWQTVDCDTPEYIQEHVPHPEIEPGPFENSGFHVPFVASTVRVELANVGPENDTQFGADNYSIQDNVFFTGDNGQSDTVQFTDQAQPDGNLQAWFNQVYSNNICVWQVDNPQQNYDSTCYTIDAPYIDMVQGFTRDNGTLESGVPVPLGHGSYEWVAVVAQDDYNLEAGDRWDNSTGSILGYGNGSEAVFAGNEIEANTTVDGTTCLNADSFWIESFPTFCNTSQRITNKTGPGPGQAFTSYSPSSLTGGWGTAETNNLLRVNAPGLTGEWYNNDYNTEMSYTATPTGHCWTGKSPFCGI
jgi:hypothetical protein